MKWNIDPSHSTAEFTVRHLMITNVRGRFGKLEGTVNYDPEKPEATTIEATIDATSIDTRDEKRDAHLKSADFFDVEKNPTLTFKSKRVTKTGDGFAAVGDLTMHGITKEITLDVIIQGTDTDPWGNTRAGLEIVGKLLRSDFDMKFNQALGSGNMLVGDKVGLALDISAVLQAS